ncbi:MAG: hypothetical protein QM711_15105 [Micropruina sp.]|uniref:hypothetical protein n=1 Tax=Micropruina sp. TaxID=2737536 RepID=UPI0039E3B1B8
MVQPEEVGEPAAVPAARLRDGSSSVEHAQPGSDWPTLCGIPADQVDLYRHLFKAAPGDCPECTERIWRLDASDRVPERFVGLVRTDDSAGFRVPVRAPVMKNARELLGMRFGAARVIGVWRQDPAQGADVVEAERLLVADQVIVIAGAGFDPKHRAANDRLAVERSPDAIAELIGLLTDRLPGEPMSLMEWPRLSLVFLKGRRPLAEYGLLAGAEWVRTPTASHGVVRKVERLRAWLRDRDVDFG